MLEGKLCFLTVNCELTEALLFFFIAQDSDIGILLFLADAGNILVPSLCIRPENWHFSDRTPAGMTLCTWNESCIEDARAGIATLIKG